MLPIGPGAEEPKDNFNFAPGFAGMPFPPFLMNGPHYHAPMSVNVNSLPFNNPRANSPYAVAIENENNKGKLTSNYIRPNYE